jgi:glycosyltransferase involved in cell wall biosynthesis
VLVAGDGPDRGDAERLARELGASNVSFLGHLPRAEVLELLRRARCLVFTSAWEEPCPMILIEAAALGVPAIASEIGGVPEIVSPATGVLVAPNDVTALADAIDAATRDPDSWHKLGRAARADYEQRFSSDRSLERLLGAYGRAGVRDR